MRRERKIVVMISARLCHLSGMGITFSIPSTIFIAGYAIKTNITTEKTRMSTIFNMSILSHNIVQQKEVLQVLVALMYLVAYHYYLK